MILAVAAALLLLIVLVGGYALAGNAVVSSRLSSAESTLDSTLSHKVDFALSISTVTADFEKSPSPSFNPELYQALVNLFVRNTQSQSATIADDNAKLELAASKLNDMQWLTVFGRASLDQASARIAHAQEALAAGKTITADLALDGHFFQAYATALVDASNFVTETNAKQSAAAIATAVLLKSDVDKALPLSNAPGLPAEVHEYMVDFQTFAADLVALLNAGLNGDQNSFGAAQAKLIADAATLSAVDLSNVDSKVRIFYQPHLNTYRQELQLASS